MDPLSLWLGALALARRVPRWVWIAAGAVVALIIVVLIHNHVAGQALQRAYDRGVTAERGRWEAQLARAHVQAGRDRVRIEQRQNTISQTIGAQNAQETRRVASAADALRLRGPGAAAAHPRPVDHPRVSIAPGGHEPAAAAPDAARPGMPAPDRATVPWGWLVDRGEEHDTGLAENRSWREWWTRQHDLRELERSAGADPPH